MSKSTPIWFSSHSVAAGVLLTATVLCGCRGNGSDDPPVHLQRNMFTQDKGKAQRENDFFADHRTMRPLDPETVSTTAPIEPTAYTTGKDENGQFVSKEPVGQLFDVISHGVRTMPSYGYQVPISDRWAIVAYVRALQRSQNLNVAQLSPEQRNNLK